jgi:hypothetical protein
MQCLYTEGLTWELFWLTLLIISLGLHLLQQLSEMSRRRARARLWMRTRRRATSRGSSYRD